jgi:hypothetical protein
MLCAIGLGGMHGIVHTFEVLCIKSCLNKWYAQLISLHLGHADDERADFTRDYLRWILRAQ